MRVLITLLLVIFAFAANLALAHKDNCPNSPFLPVAPSDLIQAKDLPADELAFHEKYMKIALDRVIEVNGKFGAAIVHKNGTLMCVSVNQGGVSRIYHGEIAAIINCTNIFRDVKGIVQPTWTDYYMYTTGEPCPMCSAAILWAKFTKVIFGSYVSNMYCERCFNQLPMAANEIFKLGYGINHNTQLIGGVLESETDKRFPVICNTNDSFAVTPMCQEGWARTCPRPSRYFGVVPKEN